MQTIILNYLENFWELLSSIAPYILIGIFLAGAMKLFIKDEWIKRELGDGTFKSSLKAILLGIPLPLCSCSVIPFATSLRKSGASRSSTLSFLIATPITGVDSIAATYGVLGWFFTLYRVLSSIVIALLAGVLSMVFDREGPETSPAEVKPDPIKPAIATPAAGGTFSFQQPATATAVFTKEEPEEACSGGSCCTTASSTVTAAEESWIEKLWHQSVYTIFGDFTKALFIGIALGALLVTFMPESLSAYLGENLWVNYLLVILIAAPLYICATSSIPLGVALLAAGFSPGAVFVFLTAGPASSTVTMSVVKKVLGTRSLILYLVAVIVGTLLFGALFDTFFAEEGAAIVQMAQAGEKAGFLAQISAVFLLILGWKVVFPRKSSGCCG